MASKNKQEITVQEPYTSDIKVRLTESEKKLLTDKANEIHGTLSQTARFMMFSKKNNILPVNLKEGDEKQHQLLAVKSLVAAHKKTAEEVRRVTDSYGDIFTSMAAGVQTSAQVLSLTRLYLALIDKVMAMQKDLNVCLSLLGQKDIHPYAKPRGFSQVEEILGTDIEKRKAEMSRLTNLQAVVLTGRIASKIDRSKSPDGNEICSFVFDAKSFDKEGKKDVRYNAFCRGESLDGKGFEEGSGAVIFGQMRQDVNDPVPAVKVSLILTYKNNMQLAFLLGRIAEDAVSVTRKNGEEKMVFPLAVKDYFKGAESIVTYKVAADKTKVMPFLKKGRTVVVAGAMHRDEESGSWLLFADNIELTSDKF